MLDEIHGRVRAEKSLSWSQPRSGDVLDDIEPRTGFAEVQLDGSAVADHTHGTVDDVLQNRFQSPATHLDLHRSQMAAGNDFLPERAQQVEGEHAAQQHDPVHAELAGGQLLDVEVTLQFAVKLFAGAMVMVKCAHFGRRTGQVRPVSVHFDGGDEQPVAIRIGQSFDDLEGHWNGGHCGLGSAGAEMIHETSINVLAVAALLQVPDPAGCGQPLLGAFTAQVAFDDEELFAEVREVFLRIVAAVQPDQATSVQPQRLQFFHASADKLRGAFLAVLPARAQFVVEHVALGADVGKDRRVAIVLFVSERHALLVRTGVVKGTHVDVHRDQIQMPRTHRAENAPTQKRLVQPPQCRLAALCGQLVQALPQRRLRRQIVDPERMREHRVFGVEVRIGEVRAGVTQHPRHGHKNVPVADRAFTAALEVLG